MTTTATDTHISRWEDFIGQERAVEQLRTACQAASGRGEPLPHLLLASGAHGIGKTTLARLVAIEMGAELHESSGKMDVNAARIRIAGMEPGDILFLDEIHQLVAGSKAKAEWLLHVLLDGYILGPRGPEDIPPLTVIGATTDVGRLPETITSRFLLHPTLTGYSDEEAAYIVNVHFARILPFNAPPLPPDEVRAVARAANNNPRMMRKILFAMRDLWEVNGGDTYDLKTAFGWANVLEDGLTTTAAQYLVVLLTEYEGQAGEKAMTTRLQEPGGLATTERLLAEKGLIAFTRSGRTLTTAGIRRARELESTDE